MTQYVITKNASQTSSHWTTRQELNFDGLAKLLTTPIIGKKEGACYTPATFDGYARRMDKAVRIDIAVLDADCGHNLTELEAAVRKKGWVAIIHSTHSHMCSVSVIAARPFETWQAENRGETVETYLLQKKGFLPRVVKGARITDEVRDGNARNLVVEHQPCPKFRVVVPLEKPWVAAEFESQNAANTRWRERIGALAFALDMHHDQSCVDTSRLFYFPRIKSQESIFEYAVIREGTACPLFELPDAAIEAPLFNAPAQPRLQEVKVEHVSAVSDDGEFVDLTLWAAQYASRFQIVDALREKAPRIFTTRKNAVKAHIICPNSGDHVTSGAEQTGTYAVNAADLPLANLPSITSGFVIHCMHAGCSHHDRLDHLRAMLADGTLQVSDLTNEKFLLPEIWPEPIALPTLPTVPPFDLSMLPDKFASWIDDISGTARFSPDFAAVTAMVAFGSLVGRRLSIRMKALSDWIEYANVWGMIVGTPATLKSPAMRPAISPLKKLQVGADKSAEEAALKFAAEREMTKIRNDAAKKKAKESLEKNPDCKPGLTLEAEPTAPPRRIYWTSDVTVERLGEILVDNPTGLLIERDELSSWLTNLEDERNATARGFFLSGWSGSEGYRFDRISRGKTSIPAFALSVVGGIQPGPLERYVRGAFSGERADGLLQRFQMAVWPDSAKFEYVDRPPNRTVHDAVAALFKFADTFDPMSIGTADNFGKNPPSIGFDARAQGLFVEWYTDFMKTRRAREAAGEDSLALSAHFGKYPGLLGKLALSIHIADCPTEKEIGERTIMKALAWLEYLAPHARRIYHGANSPDADAARLLLARIQAGKVQSPFKARDIYRNGWHGLGIAEHVKSACRVLVDYGYLREVQSPASPGRPSDPVYQINPRICVNP